MFQGDSEIDQLYRIFRQFGTPDETNWKNIHQLPDFKPSFPKWERQVLPHRMYSDNDAVELFLMMTKYDPDDRISARDSLNHRYFDNVTLVPVQLPLPPGTAPSNTHQFVDV
jgi:cyclin-dependent kinase 2